MYVRYNLHNAKKNSYTTTFCNIIFGLSCIAELCQYSVIVRWDSYHMCTCIKAPVGNTQFKHTNVMISIKQSALLMVCNSKVLLHY